MYSVARYESLALLRFLGWRGVSFSLEDRSSSLVSALLLDAWQIFDSVRLERGVIV